MEGADPVRDAQDMQRIDLNGATLLPGFLGAAAQREMADAIAAVIRAAPLVQPVTPGGRKMSVRMTAAGRLGWVSDRRGYRYQPFHPEGFPWPPIPACVLRVWHALVPGGRDPDCCLINHYGPGARMGLHQDRDEGDFGWPVVSISLGDSALFRVGGRLRGDPTRSAWLHSGDVVVLGGPARLAYHGVDRIRPGSSTLLPGGGRLNLTLRVVAGGTYSADSAQQP